MGADAERLFDVMVGEYHGDATAGEIREQIPELRRLCGVDTSKRLVANDDTRRAREDPTELEPSSFPSRQETGASLRVVVEKHLLDELADPLRVGFSTSNLDEGRDVLLDREVPKHARALGHVPEAPARAEVERFGGHVAAIERHAAFVVAFFAYQHSKERGFSRSGRTQ